MTLTVDGVSVLGAILLLAWALLAAAGWLLPMRDGLRRYTLRYLAWGFIFCYWIATIGETWYWTALHLGLALSAAWRITHWWRLTEQIRADKRLYNQQWHGQGWQ